MGYHFTLHQIGVNCRNRVYGVMLHHKYSIRLVWRVIHSLHLLHIVRYLRPLIPCYNQFLSY